MVRHNCHGISISTHPLPVNSSFCLKNKKELFTGEGCLVMDIPWQLCRTIGPLLSQRFPFASAKAQPSGGFQCSAMSEMQQFSDKGTRSRQIRLLALVHW